METKKCIRCGKEVPANENGSSLIMEEDLDIAVPNPLGTLFGPTCVWIDDPIHIKTKTTFTLTYPEGEVLCPRCAVRYLMYSAQKALAQYMPEADPFNERGN